jgi:hypothetical protein
LECLCEGAEGEWAPKGHGGDNIGGGNESMGSRICIITSSEVAVYDVMTGAYRSFISWKTQNT